MFPPWQDAFIFFCLHGSKWFKAVQAIVVISLVMVMGTRRDPSNRAQTYLHPLYAMTMGSSPE